MQWKNLAVGFGVGIVAGAVYQNAVKLGLALVLIVLGQRYSSAFSTASSLGLLTGFAMLAYYTLRARKYATLRQALGRSLVGLGYALLYFGGAGSAFYMATGSRDIGVKIIGISFVLSLVFFIVGKLLFKNEVTGHAERV